MGFNISAVSGLGKTSEGDAYRQGLDGRNGNQDGTADGRQGHGDGGKGEGILLVDKGSGSQTVGSGPDSEATCHGILDSEDVQESRAKVGTDQTGDNGNGHR